MVDVEKTKLAAFLKVSPSTLEMWLCRAEFNHISFFWGSRKKHLHNKVYSGIRSQDLDRLQELVNKIGRRKNRKKANAQN